MEVLVALISLVIGWYAKEQYDKLMTKKRVVEEDEQERKYRERQLQQYEELFAYTEKDAIEGGK